MIEDPSGPFQIGPNTDKIDREHWVILVARGKKKDTKTMEGGQTKDLKT